MADVAAPAERAATKWGPAFEAVLRAILRDYADVEDKVRDGMAVGMRKLFERPYEAELGALRAARSGSKSAGAAAEPLTLEDAQRVIFFPRLSDMQYYADALAKHTPTATNRREQLMKIKMVSVFYTLHRRDGALVDRFMHCGGLQSLVELVADENPVVQSEAVELLIEMLTPHMQLGSVAASARQSHLHQQIWLCLRSRGFWANFAKIIGDPAEQFPNSHQHSVQLLAGAVGWLKPEEEDLPEAVPPPDVSEAAEALQAYLDSGASIQPDVRSSSEYLLGELQEVPRSRAAPLQGAELREAQECIFGAKAVDREDRAHAWQALRRLGNEAVKAGLVWPAEASYSLALAEGGAAVPDTEAAAIQSNRALVLLKAGHHMDAADAAAKALERDPRNSKAAFRRAKGLLGHLSSPSAAGGPAAADAKEWAAEALRAAKLAVSLEPKDASVAEVLRQAQAAFDDAEAAERAAAVESTPAGGADGAVEADGQVLDEMD